MKAVILCGGLGTRLSEETALKPKPMVEIGGQPVLWHILKIFAAQGFREFVLALGYKGDVIKDYFIHYLHRTSNLTVHMKAGTIEVREGASDDWVVHLLDTGLNTQTGGRIKRAAHFIGREPFMLTYGDGVANIDLSHLLAFHKAQGALGTVTAVRPPARFGSMVFDGDRIARFEEKPQTGEGWINGGFFVLQPEVTDYIMDDACFWEREPMEQLATQGQLAAYKHNGFWQCMDTLRDVRLLETLWQEGHAPWKIWKD
ncbi:MAG: glucose-1-phosphate cytidylyltransferase [Kiritimatiellaeota bacterium]|nr:glucose-1-phosphate cytidylyltransferase [Kiritimatiellota bacterium]